MDIKNDLKNGAKLAADAATDVVQGLIEKSRLRANANRIKQVIKGDTELRNQAYIELGRYFYENMRDNCEDEQEALCVVVDKTTKRIQKATLKYVELINQSNDQKLSGENTEKLKQAISQKATVVKEKAKDTTNKAKAKAQDLTEKAKLKAQDLSIKTKETVADIKVKAKDKVDDIKAFITPDDDVEELIVQQDEMTAKLDAVVEEAVVEETPVEAVAEKPAAKEKPAVVILDDEESPEDFDF